VFDSAGRKPRVVLGIVKLASRDLCLLTFLLTRKLNWMYELSDLGTLGPEKGKIFILPNQTTITSINY